MKRFLLFVLVGVPALTACAPKAQEPAAAVLKISDGTIEKTYTADDLKALSETQATFQDVTYVGVPLTVLLQDAGIDITALTAVKAVAIDGLLPIMMRRCLRAKIRSLHMRGWTLL